MRDEIIATMAKRAASIFSKDEADFTADTTFEELGMKSVNYSQIIAYCEDEYDV